MTEPTLKDKLEKAVTDVKEKVEIIKSKKLPSPPTLQIKVKETIKSQDAFGRR